MNPADFALCVRVLWTALFLTLAAPLGMAQKPTVEQLSERIAAEGDDVAPQVFYDLASIGTLEALAILESTLAGLGAKQQREYLLDACAIFADQRTRDAGLAFLSRIARSGTLAVDKLAAVRALAAFDSDALEVLLAIAREGTDIETRCAAADGLAPYLLASKDPDSIDLVFDLALARPDPATKRRYVGLTVDDRKSGAGLTHRDLLARCAARMKEGAALEHALARLVEGRVTLVWKRVLVDALGDRPDAAVVQTLVRLLRDLDATLVLAALEKLASHRERGAWDTFDEDLKPLLAAKDDAIRRAAVFALGAFGASDPRWGAEVLVLAKSKDRVVRQGAARALGELRTPAAIELLGALLADKEWVVRFEALKALERLRLPETVPLLIERVATETVRMADEIDFSLRLLTGQPLSASSWKAWLADQPRPLVLPSYEEAVAAENLRRGAGADGLAGGSAVGFFDIRIVSDRVIFICDMSSSMEELVKELPKSGGSVVREGRGAMTRFELAKKQLRSVLTSIPDDTLFNVYFFSNRLEPFTKEMVRMKRATRAKAERWVQDQFANGSTNVYDALQAAYLEPTVDTIYILTDGFPTEGELTDEGEIRERVAHWNKTRHIKVHAISLGRYSPLLEGLALDTGGTYREYQ